MNRNIRLLMPVFALLLLSGLLTTGLVGAQNDTILSIAVPDSVAELLHDGLAAQFEAAHPGVRLNIIETGGGFFGFFLQGDEIESYLDDIEEQIIEADVRFINSADVTPESVRAGYFLNLSPLVSVDAGLNPNDFYPPVWQSYQWDGGIWALPLTVDVIGMLYDPAAFDDAGLAYPTESWTIFDIEQAARSLAQFDENGELIEAPLLDLGNYMRVVALNTVGQGVVNVNTVPSAPDYSHPQLEEVMNIWADLEAEGLIGGLQGGFGLESPVIMVPSVISNIAQLAGDREFITLPGGRTNLDVTGLAVSSATQSPELAYELAKFLTTIPEVTNAASGIIPARQRLGGIQVNQGVGPDGGGGPGAAFGNISPEALQALQPALASGYSVAELRFSDAIAAAVEQMVSDGVDARTALQNVELDLFSRLQAADARVGRDLRVALPPTELQLAAGKIRLNFGVNPGFGGPQGLPNEDEWDRAIAGFVATDPQVGQIILSAEQNFGDNQLQTMTEQFDCFVLPSNAVQGADLSTILSLDPLLASDPTFNPNDIVGNVLAQIQQNNLTWALPLSIQPDILLYNTNIFQNAGAPQPFPGWGVGDFENSLRTVDFSLLPDEVPFVPSTPTNTYLLTLLAAYGGIPIDYSTEPATLNYTDPATVDAIRQVLDLARDGLIEYQELGGIFGGRGVVIGFGTDEDVALYNQLLNSFLLDNIQQEGTYQVASYPEGVQLNAVSYDVGTAYISASTQYPDACYRFISVISQNPALFPSAMPARRSLINSPQVTNVQGADTAAFYMNIDQIISQPTTLLIPTPFGGGIAAIGEFLIAEWLNQVFDAYVAGNDDLDSLLADAQVKSAAFQECLAALPPFNPGQGGGPGGGGGGFFQKISNCASQADPELELFGQ